MALSCAVGWGGVVGSGSGLEGAEAAGVQAAMVAALPAAAASLMNLRRLILAPLVWSNRGIVLALCGGRSRRSPVPASQVPANHSRLEGSVKSWWSGACPHAGSRSQIVHADRLPVRGRSSAAASQEVLPGRGELAQGGVGQVRCRRRWRAVHTGYVPAALRDSRVKPLAGSAIDAAPSDSRHQPEGARQQRDLNLRSNARDLLDWVEVWVTTGGNTGTLVAPDRLPQPAACVCRVAPKTGAADTIA